MQVLLSLGHWSHLIEVMVYSRFQIKENGEIEIN